MKRVLTIAVIATLAGCASPGYDKYLAAQTKATADHEKQRAAAPAKPLLKITAAKGQTITGLESIEVNLPEDRQASAAPVIQPPSDPWASVAERALGVVGNIGGIWAGGRAAIGLAGAVGNAANAGYAHVQAPGTPAPNVTTLNTTTNTSTNTDARSTSNSNNSAVDSHAVAGSYNPATDNHSNQNNPITTYPTK